MESERVAETNTWKRICTKRCTILTRIVTDSIKKLEEPCREIVLTNYRGHSRFFNTCSTITVIFSSPWSFCSTLARPARWTTRPGLFVDRVREKWSVQSVERQTESRVTFADSGTKNGTTECQLFRAQHCQRCNVADVSTNLWKTSRRLHLFEKIRRQQCVYIRGKNKFPKSKTKTKDISTFTRSDDWQLERPDSRNF